MLPLRLNGGEVLWDRGRLCNACGLVYAKMIKKRLKTNSGTADASSGESSGEGEEEDELA